jgi:hypothetical protein
MGSDPAGLGDPSLLGSAFDDLDEDQVGRHFGEKFADALLDLEPGHWSGPVQSPYGIHLILVMQREPARQPALAEIRDEVLAEWRDQRRREAREQAYQRLRERYEVVMEPEAQGETGAERVSPSVSASVPSGEEAGAIAVAPEAPADRVEERP